MNVHLEHELVYSKVYKGRMTEFAEPAFAYTNAMHKGNPRWQRVIVLGKTESQDTYVVFTGATIMLTRSVRRIATDWKCHLGSFIHFNSPTWRFKAGFGGRIIPTKRSVQGQPASSVAPQGAVLPSPFHDKDAEDVKQKMNEEKTEEREQFEMGQHDQPTLTRDDGTQRDASSSALMVEPSGDGQSSPLPSMASRPGEVVVDSVFDDAVDYSFLPAMEGQVDPGLSVPVTPPMASTHLPATPRQTNETRAPGPDDDQDHEAKRARVETQKKQKINRMMEFNESMTRTVKVGADEFSTLDDYSNELDLNEDSPDDEFWSGEDQVSFASVPDALWSDLPPDKLPPHKLPPPQEAWVDALADSVEIDRLLKMEVLTTCFVYDWSIKEAADGTKTWMRNSRFVVREFATLKRDDTYSPATGSHSANLVPLMYLRMLVESMDASSDGHCGITVAALDIMDAFLQVPQEKLVGVSLYNQQYIIKRNLPGQKVGSKIVVLVFQELRV